MVTVNRYRVEMRKDRFLIVAYKVNDALGDDWKVEGCLVNDYFYVREVILNWDEVESWHTDGFQLLHSRVPEHLKRNIFPARPEQRWSEMMEEKCSIDHDRYLKGLAASIHHGYHMDHVITCPECNICLEKKHEGVSNENKIYSGEEG